MKYILVIHFKVKGLRGDYPNSYQIVPSTPIQQRYRCTVVFSKVLRPINVLNFMKYYFIT